MTELHSSSWWKVDARGAEPGFSVDFGSKCCWCGQFLLAVCNKMSECCIEGGIVKPEVASLAALQKLSKSVLEKIQKVLSRQQLACTSWVHSAISAEDRVEMMFHLQKRCQPR